MPGYGALLKELREKSGGEKRLKTMTIQMPSNEDPSAGHVIEHANHPPDKPERFEFARNEKSELAAHLSKHLGLKLPGKAADKSGSAEPEVSKADFE